MPPRQAALETLYTAALALWLGVLLMTGVAAASIFPAVKKLNPTIPEFTSYAGEHWLLLGGQVANRLFLVAYIAGFALLLVAVLLLAAMSYWRTLTYSALAARWLSLLLPSGLMAYDLFILLPRMQRSLAAYWAAASDGQNERAAILQGAFKADHPTATLLLGLLVGALLLALGVAGWSAAHQRQHP